VPDSCLHSALGGVFDYIIDKRRVEGLRGLCVQWGFWSNATCQIFQNKLNKIGLPCLSPYTVKRLFYSLMKASTKNEKNLLICQCISWSYFLLYFPSSHPFLNFLYLPNHDYFNSIDVKNLTHAELVCVLCSIAKTVSGCCMAIEGTTHLMDIDFDSLSGLEFQNTILDITGIDIPQTRVFDNPTIDGLADYIIRELNERQPLTSSSSNLSNMREEERKEKCDTLESFVRYAVPDTSNHSHYIHLLQQNYVCYEDFVKEKNIQQAVQNILHLKNDSIEYHSLVEKWGRCQKSFLEYSSLIKQQEDITSYDKSSISKKEQTKSYPTRRLCHTRQKQYDPWVDVETFCNTFKIDIRQLKPAVRPQNIQHVLLTGVTGFVGRFQLYSLLHLREKDDIIIHCLVRSETIEEGMHRLRSACQEAFHWETSFEKRIQIHLGDFSKYQLGLDNETYQYLVETIDLIYHTGGNVNLLCGYSRLRDTNFLSVQYIIDLACTSRLKPIHFTSTLGQYPSFFSLFTEAYKDDIITEDIYLSKKNLLEAFPPQRQGYPWSKWAAEQLLYHAAKQHLPIIIYRLPNMYISHLNGYTNLTDYAAAFFLTCVQEGMLVLGATTAPLTPVDTIADMIIKRSFLDQPQYWQYNLMDTRVLTTEMIIEWSKELGINLNPVSFDTFLKAIRKRGASSPIFRFVPLMQYWRKYWFDTSDVHNTHHPVNSTRIFEDLPSLKWPDLKETFFRSFMYCMQQKALPSHSLALTTDINASKNYAMDVTQVSDFGPCEEYLLNGIQMFQNTLFEECNPTFAGILSLHHTTRQYAINLLAMQECERLYPEIMQQNISPIIFICGLNRSGTTLLQNLFSLHSEHRTLRACEMIAPYGRDGKYRPCHLPNWIHNEEWSHDPRISFTQQHLDLQLANNEAWNAMHAQKAYYVEEDFIIFEHCGRSYSMASAFGSSTYRNWIFQNNCEQLETAYEFHSRFLKHLQWQRSAQRWILKMPFHLFTLEALFKTYPNAHIVFMHRDPIEVMVSWCSLVQCARQALCEKYDPSNIGKEELQSMASMMSKALTFRKVNPHLTNRFIDVQYSALIKEPVTTLQKIYQQLNIPFTPDVQKNIDSYLLKNSEKRKLLLRKQSQLQDYHLDADQIKQAFADYYLSNFLQQQ
jgi:thioester reductase-like protein